MEMGDGKWEMRSGEQIGVGFGGKGQGAPCTPHTMRNGNRTVVGFWGKGQGAPCTPHTMRNGNRTVVGFRGKGQGAPCIPHTISLLLGGAVAGLARRPAASRRGVGIPWTAQTSGSSLTRGSTTTRLRGIRTPQEPTEGWGGDLVERDEMGIWWGFGWNLGRIW